MRPGARSSGNKKSPATKVAGLFHTQSAAGLVAATAPGVRLVGSLGPGESDGAVDFSPAGLRDPVEANALGAKPAATPRGTDRRVKRQSSCRAASGRAKRLCSICSRVGMLARAQLTILLNIVPLLYPFFACPATGRQTLSP